jgi:hypothetical protein
MGILRGQRKCSAALIGGTRPLRERRGGEDAEKKMLPGMLHAGISAVQALLPDLDTFAWTVVTRASVLARRAYLMLPSCWL